MQHNHDNPAPMDVLIHARPIHARVQLDAPGLELPFVHSTEIYQFSCNALPAPQEALTIHHGSIELWVPMGARAAYGALGVDFKPSRGSSLVCRILLGTEGSGIPTPTWGPPSDTIHAGLPEEFALAVAGGVRELAEEHRLISGMLTVNRALYGEVGSSPRVFRVLGRIVTQLVQHFTVEPSQEALAAFLNAEWAKQR